VQALLESRSDAVVHEWDRKNGDLKFPDQMFPSVDVVVHLAAFNSTKDFYDKAFDVILDNALSTLNLLKFYRMEEKRPLFVYAGTPECATGAVEDFRYPIPTDEAVPHVIPDPLNLRWSYAGSKALGELAVIASGLPWIIFRPNNIYGPGQKNHFVPEFIERAMKGDYTLYGSDNTRSWLYIDDCVDAIVKLIQCEEARGGIVNIGSNDEIKVIELAKIILGLMEVDVSPFRKPAPKGSADRRMPDISKIKNLIEWEPTTSLEDGLKITVDSYLNSTITAPTEAETYFKVALEQNGDDNR
jgi:nucleoside-diphosphate-sugar epimerase